MIKNIYWSLYKVPLFLSDCNETWIFSTDVFKNTQISNFIKFRLVGAEFFQADRQTDRHKEANILLLAILRMRLKSYVLILTF